jgi:feruloyl esterase
MAILLASGAAMAVASGCAAQEADCTKLAAPNLVPNFVVASARTVAADLIKGTPQHCEVVGTISPVPESKIGVVYRLPSQWNGKLVGFGGGGWAGNVRIETAVDALKAGYATAQTDGGHPSPSGADTSWVAPNGKPAEVALVDFSHRAVHQMTVAGKAIVQQRYGRAQSRAYFQGCSTGGRMGLMEAQRYPEDYDGVIAGAPVYTFRVQTAEIWRDQIFTRPGAAISDAQAKMVHAASLAACDDADGIKDGIVTDPRACKFDPASVQCKAGQSGDQCLTPAQVDAFRKAYTLFKSGEAVTVYPLGRGSEDAWGGFTNVSNKPGPPARNLGLRAVMFGDPNFDFDKLDPVADTVRARQSPMAKYYEAADPDLTPFINRGGKLLLWHGFDDPGPSALATIDYYGDVQKTTGAKVGRQKLDDTVRFFLAPGVYHCAGGPGADRFDLIAAMDQWVERGQTPTRILASKDKPKMTRPLCAYPALPIYKGEGDPNDERNFQCK